MITARNILWVLLLGSIWGVAELFGRDLLDGFGLGGGSIWLAAWAVLLLSAGRGIWNRAGSSTLMGLVAAALKFAGPSPFHCQLLGIASIGVAFDLFASGLLTRGRSQWWRHALVGALTVYVSRITFVIYSVYIARWDRWVEGGSPMALEHVVRSGSIAALAALVIAPLGFHLGRRAADALHGESAGEPAAAYRR